MSRAGSMDEPVGSSLLACLGQMIEANQVDLNQFVRLTSDLQVLGLVAYLSEVRKLMEYILGYRAVSSSQKAKLLAKLARQVINFHLRLNGEQIWFKNSAVDILRKSLELDPGLADAHYGLICLGEEPHCSVFDRQFEIPPGQVALTIACRPLDGINGLVAHHSYLVCEFQGPGGWVENFELGLSQDGETKEAVLEQKSFDIRLAKPGSSEGKIWLVDKSSFLRLVDEYTKKVNVEKTIKYNVLSTNRSVNMSMLGYYCTKEGVSDLMTGALYSSLVGVALLSTNMTGSSKFCNWMMRGIFRSFSDIPGIASKQERVYAEGMSQHNCVSFCLMFLARLGVEVEGNPYDGVPAIIGAVAEFCGMPTKLPESIMHGVLSHGLSRPAFTPVLDRVLRIKRAMSFFANPAVDASLESMPRRVDF